MFFSLLKILDNKMSYSESAISYVLTKPTLKVVPSVAEVWWDLCAYSHLLLKVAGSSYKSGKNVCNI